MTARIGFDRDSAKLLPRSHSPCTYRVVRLEAGWPVVVYAGATVQPRSRIMDHVRKDWDADLVELTFHPNTTAMARAEREMLDGLVTEKPCGPGGRHGSWRAQRRGW